MSIYFYHPSPVINTASYRLRCYYPSLFFKSKNIECEVGNSLTEAKAYSKVVFSKAYSDDILAFLIDYSGETVFDLCDNHFIKSENSMELLKKICSNVNIITTSTNALAVIIEKYTGKKANVIQDVLDYWVIQQDPYVSIQVLAGDILNAKRSKSVSRSLWFGNAGSKYSEFGGLNDIPLFKNFLKSRHLNIVSNNVFKVTLLIKYGIIPYFSKFSPSALHKAAQKSSEIIIPIRKNDFTLVKSENRLLTAIALGLDIIYTQIPSYEFLEKYSQNLESDVFLFKNSEQDIAKMCDILQPYLINEVGNRWLQVLKIS